MEPVIYESAPVWYPDNIVFQNIYLHSDADKGLKILSANDAGGLVGGCNKKVYIKISSKIIN